MLPTMSIEEVQATLPEIIKRLGPGEEVIITRDDQPVAKFVSLSKLARQSPKFGSAKGMLIIHAEDDKHLKNFKAYMP
jgi:antitoxin (DNA-binding transcriptional repressor) of toxin-antitoxin stability system